MTPIRCPECGGGGSKNRPPDCSDKDTWATWLSNNTVHLWPCETCSDTGTVWLSEVFVETLGGLTG